MKWRFNGFRMFIKKVDKTLVLRHKLLGHVHSYVYYMLVSLVCLLNEKYIFLESSRGNVNVDCFVTAFKQPNVCPRGWHPGETSCYRAIPADIDFFGGISMCSFYKAIPAIINDDEEQQLLLTFGTDGYWLGTCDIVEERNFENIDGTEFNSLLFQDGEPDNMDGLQVGRISN